MATKVERDPGGPKYKVHKIKTEALYGRYIYYADKEFDTLEKLGAADGSHAREDGLSKFYNPKYAFEQEYRDAYDEVYVGKFNLVRGQGDDA